MNILMFHIKKMALLLVGAATLPELFDAILTEYNLCLRFFNIEDAGKVVVRGVKNKGDIKNTDALNEAYILGCSILTMKRMQRHTSTFRLKKGIIFAANRSFWRNDATFCI